MDLRVRYAGVPIGTVALEVPTGLAHGVLVPGDGYELARVEVESAGRILFPNGLGARRFWSPVRGDFADVVASSVAGGYDLQDLRGMPVSAASVSVFAPSGLGGDSGGVALAGGAAARTATASMVNVTRSATFTVPDGPPL